MHWRKKLLRSCYLYIIVKANVEKARKIVSSGIHILQLRDKRVSDRKLFEIGREIASFCRKKKVFFIVNDRIDIAIASRADGVHLGQGDLSLYEARKIAPRNFLIGISTHSVKEALKAQKEGADYISFGPVFATRTKPLLSPIGTEKIALLDKKIKIPCFVIGNVNLKNLKLLKDRGARRIAMHSSVYKLKNPRQKILSFRKEISL